MFIRFGLARARQKGLYRLVGFANHMISRFMWFADLMRSAPVDARRPGAATPRPDRRAKPPSQRALAMVVAPGRKWRAR